MHSIPSFGDGFYGLYEGVLCNAGEVGLYASMPEQWRKVPEGLNHPVCLNYKDWPLFDVPEQSESDAKAAPKRSYDDWVKFISCGRDKARLHQSFSLRGCPHTHVLLISSSTSNNYHTAIDGHRNPM